MKNLFKDLQVQEDLFDNILLCNYGERNKTQYYKSSDTADAFERCDIPEKVEYWKDKTIEYKFNNWGFRTYDDFNTEDEGVVTLGCSFTEGIGLPLEYCWSNKIAKYLNLKHWNLAQGGLGIHTCFRLLLGAKEKIKFKKVFLFAPPLYRKEFIVDDNKLFTEGYLKGRFKDLRFIHTLGTKISKHLPFEFEEEKNKDLMHSWLFGSQKDTIIDQIRTIYAIEGLCKDLGVEFYYLNFYHYFNAKANLRAKKITDNQCLDIPARDSHWGAKKQHLIFEDFKKLYESYNR